MFACTRPDDQAFGAFDYTRNPIEIEEILPRVETNTLIDEFSENLALTALRAGRTILEIYDTAFEVGTKDDNSPVTKADKLAEDIILADLEKFAADIPVIAEEAAAAGNIPDVGDRFFLVDPLDGTREFVNRNGQFTVNIALIENGRPVQGVVLAPVTGRLFLAARPGKCMEFSAPQSEPIQFSDVKGRTLRTATPPEAGLRVVASRSHRDQATDDLLAEYKVSKMIAAGSSLKFCLIAAGEADFYPRLGRTMEWDTAAGQAVLENAGGVVTELDGTGLRYGKKARGYDNPAFLAWGRAPK
jgi:3'(2'), 5'-bisphosphate nucleotidase